MMKKTLLIVVMSISLTMWGETAKVSRVLEYQPAPGQFVNVLPPYEAGDDAGDMALKATNLMRQGSMISLGGWGGYVVFAFDQTVPNVEGEYDFKVNGNAFTGSSEPGIVMVSADENKNGLADDTWYELTGSEYVNPLTKQNYEVVYYKPSAEKDASTGTVDEYIQWRDNEGQTGFVKKNSFHKQSYYPLWIAGESVTFSGARLPDNGADQNGNGTYYVLSAFGFGYVDNLPNGTNDGSKFKIDWAVDGSGNKVNLRGVDFVKVYTGVLQDNGWLGENSTEVVGAEGLHDISALVSVVADGGELELNTLVVEHLRIFSKKQMPMALFNLSGVKVDEFSVERGENGYDLSRLPQGIYFLRTPYKTIKILKK